MSPRGIVLFFSLVSSILVAQAPFPIAFASVEKQIDGNPEDWNLSACPLIRFENPILADPLFDNTLRAKFEWDKLNFYGFPPRLGLVTQRHFGAFPSQKN